MDKLKKGMKILEIEYGLLLPWKRLYCLQGSKKRVYLSKEMAVLVTKINT